MLARVLEGEVHPPKAAPPATKAPAEPRIGQFPESS
jgi:hypothetical protein